MLGQALDCKRDIHIGWNDCGENITYQVVIKSSVKSLFEGSTKGLSLQIPGGTVNATAGQMYYIQITAQSIHGDPFFVSKNYYSASIMAGEVLSFNVQ
jgi:hypothetical protein